MLVLAFRAAGSTKSDVDAHTFVVVFFGLGVQTHSIHLVCLRLHQDDCIITLLNLLPFQLGLMTSIDSVLHPFVLLLFLGGFWLCWHGDAPRRTKLTGLQHVHHHDVDVVLLFGWVNALEGGHRGQATRGGRLVSCCQWLLEHLHLEKKLELGGVESSCCRHLCRLCTVRRRRPSRLSGGRRVERHDRLALVGNLSSAPLIVVVAEVGAGEAVLSCGQLLLRGSWLADGNEYAAPWLRASVDGLAVRRPLGLRLRLEGNLLSIYR